MVEKDCGIECVSVVCECRWVGESVCVICLRLRVEGAIMHVHGL